MTDSIVLDAPAKLNLALHVTGRRADGYHLLETLAVFTETGDRLRLAPAATDSFAINGPRAAGLAADGDNLVVRARDLLRAAFPDQTRQPVALELEKNLPVASGIGGGSSDAATALIGLARLWGLPVDTAALAGLAAPLGADLPMCVARRPLIATGAGESLAPIARFPALDVVLVNPGVGVATADVFRRLTARDNPPLPGLPAQRDAAALTDWLGTTRNDLQAPAQAVAPVIADCLGALAAAGAGFARMSGSGATCFGLFADAGRARLAAATIAARQPGWFVMATRTTRSGD